MFYKCQFIDIVWWWCSCLLNNFLSIFYHLLWECCWSLQLTVYLYMCSFHCVSFCFISFAVLLFGAWFKIIMFYWWSEPFYYVIMPFVLDNFFFDINLQLLLVKPLWLSCDKYWHIFFLNLLLSYVSLYKQHIVGSFFPLNFANLWLLMGMFRQFALNLIVDMFLSQSVILVFVLCFTLSVLWVGIKSSASVSYILP